MKTYLRRLKQAAVVTGIAVSGIGTSGGLIPVNALTFNFSPTAGTSQQAIDGFTSAGNLWSSVLTDNVNVNININFAALGAGTLGETGSSYQSYNYGQVYSALKSDRTSVNDNTAVSSLASGSTFNMLLNRTANNPNGAGSATPYLDNNGNANNRTLEMTSANAKALGLQGNSSNSDASISFSSLFNWDFNRSDGISSGTFDFVGLAAHEIGHALGFMSGVDILDGNSSSQYYNDNQFTYVSPLDLFRYSTDSKNVNAIDWTADNRAKYFSLDSGVTKVADFSTGEIFGDGRQNSHWKDNQGLGILDPTIAPSELLAISDNDKRALDAIGWNRADSAALNLQANLVANGGIAGVSRFANAEATNVPEPADFVGTLFFVAIGGKLIQRRRRLRWQAIEQKV
ncbi:NF038122 family metalloprotease [Chamaesiphon sp. VAR_69_metabat_338]|uniref:NF038122 family metalloprotease n=1 Tax=Chamaesiphon sp. VAR_69_metabat_338 TaxID=2964704 RepID=UPI00286E058B|nr:NF038122 family metalloprotease [Chamaesiphon sp. VAR_69_metabat_338]